MQTIKKANKIWYIKVRIRFENYVKEVLLVSEDEIMDSLDIIINKLKIVVEPSSAVVLAALIKNNKKSPPLRSKNSKMI